ncbi:PIN/TRAM domain-containing protein [Clostridia bacterium]|nr:PIN/TRAM domain-containing protein [Clostridia bacterium]
MRTDKLTVALRVIWTTLIAALGAGIYMLVRYAAGRIGGATWGSKMDYYYVFVPFFAAVLIIGWFSARPLARAARRTVTRVEITLTDLPVGQVISTAIGLSFGIALGLVVSLPFRLFLPPVAWAVLAALLYASVGSIGAVFAFKRWHEIMHFGRRDRAGGKTPDQGSLAMDKILDTSVIIDGRILDVLSTGFVEGVVVIPQFVLAELRHIADSPDPMRRNRGRRGLDILARIQRELPVVVEIDETNADTSDEVDAKLLKMAVQRGGAVVTNDFNLNKVASVTGVRVLNLNDLTNALKPALLPGEECTVQIVREGKEPNQGVGFLEDGTMIVVDNARRMIGERVEAVVTTALQTSAGRMIFARLKFAPPRPFSATAVEYSIK